MTGPSAGKPAPVSARLPEHLRPQYAALCRALAASILSAYRARIEKKEAA